MRKFHIPVVLQDREHGFENWHKNEFAQGSHKVRILVIFALRFWVEIESMLLKIWSQKRIRTGGCVVQKFRTRGMGGANFAVSWLFSPVFPCLHSSSFPTYMLTQKPIQTTLE